MRSAQIKQICGNYAENAEKCGNYAKKYAAIFSQKTTGGKKLIRKRGGKILKNTSRHYWGGGEISLAFQFENNEN